MSNKKYEESSIQAIADAIRTKNGSQDTYKVSEMATAISNIQTQGTVTTTKTVTNNNSGAKTVTQDFTIGQGVYEAYLVVDTVYYASTNTFALAKQSGADITITTQYAAESSNWDAFGCSPVRYKTIMYKITKTSNASSVARLTVSNTSSQALAGVCSHLITV